MGIPTTSEATEETPTFPINPYGQSKLMTEVMLKDTSDAFENFNYIALRYFNVSGADFEGRIGQAFPGATHLIKVNCEAAAGKRDKTYIFGTDYETPDGTGIRDYIHVLDLASAHIKSLEYLMKTKSSDIFNCGYGHGYSVREVVKSVKEVTKVDIDVEEAQRREGDPPILVGSNKKILNVLGWKPKFDDLNLIIKSAFDWEQSETLTKWRESKMKKKSIVVHSGGMDSSICLALAIEHDGAENVLSISFTYGQRHSKEIDFAKKICLEWNVDHRVINISSLNDITENALMDSSIDIKHLKGEEPNTMVIGRNGLMARIAGIHAEHIGANCIYMGIIEVDSANSGYRDCTRKYMDIIQAGLRVDLNNQQFEIKTPLVYMDKKQTLELGYQMSILHYLIENTLSCYEGNRV